MLADSARSNQLHADKMDIMYIRLLVNGRNGLIAQQAMSVLHFIVNSFAIPRRKCVNMMV